MKQYELMIQTSENLIERRNVMSEKFKALCVTLISLVTTSITLNNLLLTGIALLFVGIIVIIISKSWLILLAEYSKNKEGKFAVINAIEEKLPAKMFDIEYIFNKYKGIRVYSSREQILPKTFIVIGIFFIIASLLIFGIELFILCKTGNFDLKIF